MAKRSSVASPLTSGLQVIDLPLEQLHEARWNAHVCDAATLEKLTRSIRRWGIVEPEIVRPLPDQSDAYEVLSGNHRLRIYRTLDFATAPCVVKRDLSDAEARLLAQVINNTRGADDVGKKAALYQDVVETLGHDDGVETLLALLPDTSADLEALLATATSSDGDGIAALFDDVVGRDAAKTCVSRSFTVTPEQAEQIERALAAAHHLLPTGASRESTPRGDAIALIAAEFVRTLGESENENT